MKTTLDLPSELVREIKLRAVHEGRKLKDLAAELLRTALAPVSVSKGSNTAAVPKTLPVLKASNATPEEFARMSAQEFSDWIQQVNLDLELKHYEKAIGHQYVDRAQS